MKEMMKCKHACIKCKDGTKDNFIDCELSLEIDALWIKQDDTYHYFSRDCLKFFQFTLDKEQEKTE